ncbi:MAG: Spy/CpxP family protein refolding chaperone [Desulfobacterales bacterium]|nr:Spy/CpxP family protein refolding chaperone [Desulfobacterales bacterium]
MASWAVAGPGGMGGWGRGMGPGYGAPPMGAPNLTPEQSQKLQELRQSYFNDIGPLQNQMFSKRAEMRMLWSQANPDAGKIAAKQQEIQALETQLREKATQHQLAVRKILTPEQLAQMPGMGYGMGPGMGGRMHGRW